jgi:hypothetical protein
MPILYRKPAKLQQGGEMTLEQSRQFYADPANKVRLGYGPRVGKTYSAEQFQNTQEGEVLSRVPAYVHGTKEVAGYYETVKGQPQRFTPLSASEQAAARRLQQATGGSTY